MDIKKITSTSNSSYKKWKKLHTRKGRTELQLFFVEGKTLIKEAYLSGLKLQAILFCSGNSDVSDFLSYHVPLYELSKPLFTELVQTQTPQGIVAIVATPETSMKNMPFTENQKSTFLLLDALQDPGNLGTLIRTAEAAGIDGIFLGYGTVDLYNPKVIRSAMGSLFRLPCISTDLKQLIPLLNREGVTIIGTSPYAEKEIFDYRFPTKMALLLGNEARGIDAHFQELIDENLSVPMPGSAESLNVSITAAIVLYERIRQSR